jgi:head-tail adaptor
MSVYTDFATDYLQWENVETVTVRSTRTDGTLNDQVSYAKRDETKVGRVPVAAETIVGETVDWHLPDTLLTNLGDVRIGDRIYLAGESSIDGATEVWLVDEAQRVRFNTEWKCRSVLASAASFRHKVTIQKSTTGQDSETAGATETWTVVSENRPCWVRSATPQASELFGQEASEMSHVVYFVDELEVGTTHRFVFGDRYLAVQGPARNVDEMDMLWAVPAIETPRAA